MGNGVARRSKVEFDHRLQFLGYRCLYRVRLESDGRPAQEEWILDPLRSWMYGVSHTDVNLNRLSYIVHPRLQANAGAAVVGTFGDGFQLHAVRIKGSAVGPVPRPLRSFAPSHHSLEIRTHHLLLSQHSSNRQDVPVPDPIPFPRKPQRFHRDIQSDLVAVLEAIHESARHAVNA